MSAAARFCGRCGRAAATAPARRTPGPAPVAIVAVLAIVVAVAALVAVGGLILRGVGPTNPPVAGGPGAAPFDPPASPGSTGSPGSGIAIEPADEAGLVLPILEAGDLPPAEETTPATGRLELGSSTSVANQVVGAAGGTISAGGLTITVPEGTLARDVAFAVSQTPITGAGFGDLVVPVTPLYTVDTGDAPLAAPVIVTLPAAIPDGATVMAFSWDETAGTLTPLMPIAHDGASLTVGATHFSAVFGGLVDLEKVPATVDSGFRPGQDDWEFANYGSFIAPGGHCEGQSVSAIWYYVTQHRRAGASPLYGLFDNNGAPEKTPTFGWDDSDGYRFASTVQADPVAVPIAYDYLRNTQLDGPDNRSTYEAFRLAIVLTGQPQLIHIKSAAGGAGHAMIVYRVTPDRLFIADPNYPARLRTIRYDVATGTLAPYSSGANAADIAQNGATAYTRFAYVPWWSASSEAGIAVHWAELEAGTAGDTRFPGYVLEARAGTDEAGADAWVPLVDGYRTTERRLTIRLRDPSGATPVAMAVYRGTSSTQTGPVGATQTLDLVDGPNRVRHPGGRAEVRPGPDDRQAGRDLEVRRLRPARHHARARVVAIPGDRRPLGAGEHGAQRPGRGIRTGLRGDDPGRRRRRVVHLDVRQPRLPQPADGGHVDAAARSGAGRRGVDAHADGLARLRPPDVPGAKRHRAHLRVWAHARRRDVPAADPGRGRDDRRLRRERHHLPDLGVPLADLDRAGLGRAQDLGGQRRGDPGREGRGHLHLPLRLAPVAGLRSQARRRRPAVAGSPSRRRRCPTSPESVIPRRPGARTLCLRREAAGGNVAADRVADDRGATSGHRGRLKGDRPLSFTPEQAALVVASLRFLATDAPCRSRIDAVANAIDAPPDEAEAAAPAAMFARAVATSAVIWAIDSDLVGQREGGVAQGAMDALWRLGPIRPELVATQLRCLVGQREAERRCLWTCPMMARANAGYDPGGGPAAIHPGLLGLILAEEGGATLPGIDERRREPPRGATLRHGEITRCLACDRDGTILGVDPEDGWTVVDHHPQVLQRPDGLWEVDRTGAKGPRQCGYLAPGGRLRAR